MTLATASGDGRPSARVVLLKGYGERGFLFFTNYESRKACDLAQNPQAALNFHWPWLERQIEIEGKVEKVSREESQHYFDMRPLGSRFGAIISRQSSIIEARDLLEENLKRVMSEYKDGAPPVPDFWGGYLVRPERFEFWQGRENRLHDRFLYTRDGDCTWRLDRLSP